MDVDAETQKEKLEQNSKKDENINELIKEDVFNLNSLNKEEYYVKNDKSNEKNEAEGKEKVRERSSSLRKRNRRAVRSKSLSSKRSARNSSSSSGSRSRSTSTSSRSSSSSSTSSTSRSSSTTKRSEIPEKGRKRSRSPKRSLSKRRRRRRTRSRTRTRSGSKYHDKFRRTRTKSRSRTGSKSQSRVKRRQRSISNRRYREGYASSSYNQRSTRRSRSRSLNKRSYPAARHSPFDRYARNECRSNRASSYRSPHKAADSRKQHYNPNSNEPEYNNDYYDYYNYYYYYYDYYYGNNGEDRKAAAADRYNYEHGRYSRTPEHHYDKTASSYYDHYSNYPPAPPAHDYPYAYAPADANKIRTPPIPSPEQLEEENKNQQPPASELNNPVLACANQIEPTANFSKKTMGEIRSPINQCQEVTSTNLGGVTKAMNDAELSSVDVAEKERSNTDDLNAFKTKLKMQLQEELFKEQEEMEKRASSTGSDSDEADIGSGDRKKSKKHKHHHHHHHHHQKHHHKHKSHKKSKKESKKSRDEEIDLPEDEFLDDYKKLRRSDRIKTIETHKIQRKELAITKKLNKLSKSGSQTNLIDENSLNEFDSPRSELLENRSGDNSSEAAEFHRFLEPTNEPTSAEDLKELAKLYEHIDENLYVSMKRKKLIFNKEAKRMACDCSTSEQERAMGLVPCGDDCLNRMLMIECGLRCPCGEYCTNRNFRNKTNAKIRPFKTHYKGWGLKSIENLKGNTFIIEYVGEVIDTKEFKRRCEEYAEQNNQHFYFMSLNNNIFVDATRKGNMSRFFNHSCDPNCETQKWTVNGQLRIGLFTRRPVAANEELTFDYQFQTVGKQQQKCYCSSEKCRGYLGVSSGQQNGLEHIWEESSEELSSDETLNDDDDDDTKENTSPEQRQQQQQQQHHESKVRKKFNLKIEKKNKDFDLNRQIKMIDSLSNKQSVLKLCQLMFRTENIQNRLDILDLLLETKSEVSLRLFMDYHGLKLLCSWMIDLDGSNESEFQLKYKLKILDVLSAMPVKNRTTLEECKLLEAVRKWTEPIEPLKSNNDHEIAEKQEVDQENVDDALKCVRSILNQLIDDVVTETDKRLAHAVRSLSNELIKRAKSLNESWMSLKQAFKIPKKQRIEERKEHERELNLIESETKHAYETMSDAQFNEKGNYLPVRSNSNYMPNTFHHRNYLPRHDYHPYRRTRPAYEQQQSYYHRRHGALTKEERRLLFEKRVKEEEDAAVAAAASSTALTESVCLHAQNGVYMSQTQPNQEMKLIFDANINQWVQCYVPKASISERLNSGLVLPVPMPLSAPTANAAPAFNLNTINISDSHLHDLKQAIQNLKPSVHSETSSIASPSLSSSSKSFQQNELANRSQEKDEELNAIAKKLPPFWKCKRNKNGSIFYYNIKTKKCQWEFPSNGKEPTETINSKADGSKSSQSSSLNHVNGEGSNNNKQLATQSQITSSTSSDEIKKYKDQFREKLSKLVIKLLKPYLNSDCKVGYIRNVDDFKHLARKLTHIIMEKELSRTTKFEELDLSKRVKIKSQEFVENYMTRFNGDYSRKTDDEENGHDI